MEVGGRRESREDERAEVTLCCVCLCVHVVKVLTVFR